MMSRYDMPCPPTRLIASSSSLRSYDTGISIDDGPVLNIATMSPG